MYDGHKGGVFNPPLQGGPWPYGDTPVWVLTAAGVEVPERLKGVLADRDFAA